VISALTDGEVDDVRIVDFG